MAVYKVPQDVEAEDKFLGPLTFKQFIFMGVTAATGYITFLIGNAGFWPILLITGPVMLVAGFLGFPWGREQPTEVWLAARIRFLIKPRIRIWNQSGMKQLVTVTAPKRDETRYTDGLSQTEVSSRLHSLASLLDSRGWAVKNIMPNAQFAYAAQGTDDRLIDVSSLPREVREGEPSYDVLDERNNPTAQNFNAMVQASEARHRQAIMQELSQARHPTPPPPPKPEDFSFLQQYNMQTPMQPGMATFQSTAIVSPQADPYTLPEQPLPQAPNLTPEEERAILQTFTIKQPGASMSPNGHLKTIQPLGAAPPATASNVPNYTQQSTPLQPVYNDYQTTQTATQSPVTPVVDPAIIDLAKNDDLSVATLARQASKAKKKPQSDGEVVISLH